MPFPHPPRRDARRHSTPWSAPTTPPSRPSSPPPARCPGAPARGASPACCRPSSHSRSATPPPRPSGAALPPCPPHSTPPGLAALPDAALVAGRPVAPQGRPRPRAGRRVPVRPDRRRAGHPGRTPSAVAAITAIRGLGPWTAEVYLLFAQEPRRHLSRRGRRQSPGPPPTCSAWPPRPGPAELRRLAEPWQPSSRAWRPACSGTTGATSPAAPAWTTCPPADRQPCACSAAFTTRPCPSPTCQRRRRSPARRSPAWSSRPATASSRATPATHARVNARPEAMPEARHPGRRVRLEPSVPPPACCPPPMLRRHARRRRAGPGRGGSAPQPGPPLHPARPTRSCTRPTQPPPSRTAVFFGPDTYRFADAIAAELRTRTAPVRNGPPTSAAAPAPAAWSSPRPRPGSQRPDARHQRRPPCAWPESTPLLNATHRAPRPRHSDLLAAAPGLFDLIVANPPYLVDPAERAYRHGGGPARRRPLPGDRRPPPCRQLAPGGTLLLYTGAAVVNGTDPFHETVIKQLYASDVTWNYRELDPDVFGEELESGTLRHHGPHRGRGCSPSTRNG